MASTYGWLWGKAKNAATRCGDKEGVTSKVATYSGYVTVHLDKEGNARIDINGAIKAKVFTSDKAQAENFKHMSEDERRLRDVVGS